MDEQSSKNIKFIAIFSSIGFIPLLLFILFITIFFVLGLFDFTVGSNSGSSTTGAKKECGFTISATSLSKSEYKSKIEQLAETNSKFEPFANNADDIYELAISKNVNPELVVIRAYVEGNGKVTGSNNYWGLGCTNESQGAGCYSWDSFEEGYTYFIDVVAKYDSLAEMMGKYAYIGKYWYTLDTPNPDGDGGCYYANYIYTSETMPDHVKKACASDAPSCIINGDTTNCTATTEEDQQAYATWQVKQNMGSARKTIFGLEFDEGPCSNSNTSNLSSLTSYTLKHEGLTVLNRTLTLTEVAQLNQYINKEVDEAGYGTGSGVAAAGQALTYGLEQKGYYLEYRWGGGHSSNFVGVSASWGSTSNGCDSNNRCYNGLDCSGFVSWAIRTACNPSFGTMTTSTMVSSSFGKKVSISETKPGDLMLKNGHVRLVIKNNGDGTVIVAEEAGSPISGLIFNKLGASSEYNFIDMTSYYNNFCNASR